MKIYQVGGAVRDRLLGRTVHDIDYVVVGGTVDGMLANGFRPVGSYFPVFLHPHTHAEYALARTERKTAPGHQGFIFHADPTVRLEEDLLRRDLTINAMAQEVNDAGELIGDIVDPYGGQADLRAGVLRHVSDAFLEDPLRVLRVARFAARFFNFQLAPETLMHMKRMVAARELETLSKERIWQELARAMEESAPLRFIEVLDDCNALNTVLPDAFVLQWQQPKQRHAICIAMNALVAVSPTLSQRVACLLRTLNPAVIEQWAKASKWPHEIAHYCQIAADFDSQVSSLVAQDMLDFFNRADLWRKPQRIKDLFMLYEALGVDVSRWQAAVNQLMDIDAGTIAAYVSQKTHGDDLGRAIALELERVRLKTIHGVLLQ